jgi:hypothetical protein
MFKNRGYCVAIGNFSAAYGRGCVAIGDFVSVVEDANGKVKVSPDDVLKVGPRMAIGDRVLGEKCNLKQILGKYIESGGL